MAPRPDVSEERMSQILDAATEVISKRGFKDASMDDIVSKAKISKGLLYWYFKGKDAVLVALVNRFIQPEMRKLEKLPGQPGTARERLFKFVDDSAKQLSAMMGMIPIVFEFYVLAFRNKGVRKVLVEFFGVYLKSVREVIEQGVRAGEFRGVDPAQAAVTLGAVLEGVMLLWLFDFRAADLSTQLHGAAELVVKGMESGGKKK
jgi:AcrR family transcriptional regulator